MANDLEAMKERVANEIGQRTDLDDEIASAITTAIEEYQVERFYFNESRDVTFQTVNGTEFYTALTGDVDHVSKMLKIDWVTINVGNMVDYLDPMAPAEMDDLSNAGTHRGQPYAYSIYSQKLRLYPVPTSAWTVRLAGLILKAAPASDVEANNVWMTDAELLIRSRAKYEIAVHVEYDVDMAAANSPHEPPAGSTVGHAAWHAYERLKARTSKQTGTGRIRPYR